MIRSLSSREKMSYSRSPRAVRSMTVGTRGMPDASALAGGLRPTTASPSRRSGRRRPAGSASAMRRRSSADSSTSAAPTFSSRRDAPLRARDRHDVVALGQDPGQRELRRRARPSPPRAPRRRRTSSRLRSKFSPWKRGEWRRKSSGARSSTDLIAPERNPRPSGEYGDEADPELPRDRQDLVLDVARPQRVLGLQRRDRVRGVRAAQRLRRPPRRARGSAPCPPGRARPWRRRSPRSACRGRRGAGSRGRRGRTPRRRSERLDARSDVLRPAVDAAARGSLAVAHDARTSSRGRTSSRRPSIARPTSSSFVHGPYMSAVSRSVHAEVDARGGSSRSTRASSAAP